MKIGNFPQKEETIKLLNSDQKLNCKLGVDPTATEVTFGWLVVLRELATLQKQGHKATLIIGDFTASIGDPTGKSKTRIPLSTSQINKNIKQLLPQIFTILDSNHTTIEFNKSWLSKITLSEMLITLSKITVSQALGRNDFQNRLENNQPVGMHEIIYPICQALDSVHIKADLELGGEDQLFNVMMGRDLMKQLEMKPQLPLLFPLLLGTDGINKMSQSLGNFISIRETPENMFGKIMSIPDSIMENWTNLLTDLDFETIAQENPRDTKLILAENIVSALHSTEKAKEAKENFVNRFSNGIISKEIEKIKISEANNWLELVNKLMPEESNSFIKRLFKQNAVKIDGNIAKDCNNKPIEGILNIGKVKMWRITNDS